MYINRSLENRVKYMAEHFSVILVAGQCLKLTLFPRLLKGMRITDQISERNR